MAWWYMPIISELRRLRQEDNKGKDSFGCIGCPEAKQKQNPQIKQTARYI